MSAATAIEWADSTFNPWRGCSPVGPGCDHCYAAALSKRTGGPAYASGAPRMRTTAAYWNGPLRWNRAGFAECTVCHFRGEAHCTAECPACGRDDTFLANVRRRVFCASLADVFDNEVDPAWRTDLFELIHRTQNLDWLLLTKRIGNAARMIDEANMAMTRRVAPAARKVTYAWPWPNVWLGATVVNEEEADRDIPKLLATPAAARFLSCEPLLGPIDLRDMLYREIVGGEPIDWVIAGGESGPGARPMHPDWARSLRDQCASASVPFLFKQWGEWWPSESEDQPVYRAPHQYLGGIAHAYRLGKSAAGRLLDGREHNGFPRSRA